MNRNNTHTTTNKRWHVESGAVYADGVRVVLADRETPFTVPEERDDNIHKIAADHNGAPILAEFIADIEAVGIEKVADDWPDLAATYFKWRHLQQFTR